MDAPLAGLTDAQRAAASHPGGPLLVLGGAGTGKTRTLMARLCWLVSRGAAPESVLLLTLAPATARELRARVEAQLDRPYEELWVCDAPELCARLLREQAPDAAVDPFPVAVSGAERVAMLLDRLDDLGLRHHDFRGDPAALLAGFVRRIDTLKAEMISARELAAWAARLPQDGETARTRAAREREFADTYLAHDRMLAEAGALDAGDLLLRAVAVARDRTRAGGGLAHVLVDDYPEAVRAERELVRLLAGAGGDIAVTGDDDGCLRRLRGAGARNLTGFTAEHPGARTVVLEESLRCRARVLDAAQAVVAPNPGRLGKPLRARPGGEVAFWRCANERAQAQGVAADVEGLIARSGVAPEAIAVLVRSVRHEGQAVAVALEERAVPHRVLGAATFFQRPEVRDLLAWLRLLVDPTDAGAVVRALARPPIELRSVDVARCTQIARRRRLDMVSALVAATESPQIPPEARDRIVAFLRIHRWAAAAFDTVRPDLYVHRLIERLGLRRQLLFAATGEVVERLSNLARFGELAAARARRHPQDSARDFAAHITAVAEAGVREEEADGGAERRRGVAIMPMHAAAGREFDHVYVLGLHAARLPGRHRAPVDAVPDELLRESLPGDGPAVHEAHMRRLLHVAMTRARRRLVLAYPREDEQGAERRPSPFVEEARAAVHAAWEERGEELFGPTETLHAAYRHLREQVLATVAQTGQRLGELRFDTDLDVSHAVVRYLELVKLAALIARSGEQGAAEALPEINARLLGAVTAEQREILLTSTLDEHLVGAQRDERRRAAAAAAREEPSLEAFLPRRGEGLMLSASDIETYRTCPLRYKFARVFRIPVEPTLHQRFGILVHQVLERFHAGGDPGGLDDMLSLLDAGWRRGGFGDSEQERQLRAKAVASLGRYVDRLGSDPARPVWFERPFAFRLGPHLLRGRVDRVDRLPDGGYELIDYKTSRPRSARQLREDVQLSLYAVGAREAWRLEAAQRSYYYVLDDEKVEVGGEDADLEWIADTVMEVGAGILSQGFEPTPSVRGCATCDYRIVCPAAER